MIEALIIVGMAAFGIWFVVMLFRAIDHCA